MNSEIAAQDIVESFVAKARNVPFSDDSVGVYSPERGMADKRIHVQCIQFRDSNG